MLRSKTKSIPPHYPFLYFHLVRTFSLVSAVVVSAILSYFTYHLSHDKYKIPWTFLVLLAVALLTLLTLALTFAIHICHFLSPRLNLLFNIPLFILWSLGLGLLAWNMSGTLGHVCNNQNWGSSAGIMVCRLYKSLFTFTVTGWAAAVASVFLDIIVRRKQTRRGAYNQMGDPTLKEGIDMSGALSRRVDYEAPKSVPEISVEPYRNEGNAQRLERGSHANHTYRDDVNLNDFGYQAPTEQTAYDAASYGDRR